jgi:hypothetical protein
MPLDPHSVRGVFENVSDILGEQISVLIQEALDEQLKSAREGARRDSLVTAYTERAYNEFAKHNSRIRSCVVTVAGLQTETNNLKYVGNEVIGGWGYTIYV